MLRRFKSFQKGTVGLCRSTGCKVKSCQSWRCEKNSADRPELNYSKLAQGRLLSAVYLNYKKWSRKKGVYFEIEKRNMKLDRLSCAIKNYVCTFPDYFFSRSMNYFRMMEKSLCLYLLSFYLTPMMKKTQLLQKLVLMSLSSCSICKNISFSSQKEINQKRR